MQVEQGDELKRSGLQLLEREARAPWSKSFSKTKIVGHTFARGNVDGTICINARNSQRRKEQAGVLDNPDASNLASETKMRALSESPERHENVHGGRDLPTADQGEECSSGKASRDNIGNGRA